MNWQDTLLRILTAETNDLHNLAEIAGKDAKTFYRDANFRESDLTKENLLALDLSSANLEHAKLNSDVEHIIKLQRESAKLFSKHKMEKWATTQNNLGTALATLGERESGTARLEQAVEAYHNALQEWTQDKVPLDWAMTQNNLGNALAVLGQRESGTARLEQAIDAYHKALQERAQDKMPLDWAITQLNLGGVHLAYFDKTKDRTRLDKAEAHVQAALQVFEQAAPHYAGIAQRRLQRIAERREAAG